MDDLHHLAIHEAGHAVIGRVFDLTCSLVTIEPDDESDGHSIIPDPWDIVGGWDEGGIHHRSHDVAMRARIMAFMAGRVAEEECLGSCYGGDGEDRRQIDLMLDSLLPPDADVAAYAIRLEAKLRPVVRRHRVTIERVAAELLNCRHLTAAEVDALI